MTMPADLSGSNASDVRPSLLPFKVEDLVALRVLPSEFARMVGVSKQTVSQWLKLGKVTLGPDGRLDPHKGAREVLQRTDPARLRARVFKDAMAGTDQLRIRVRELEQQLADQRQASDEHAKWVADATCNRCMDKQAEQLYALQEAFGSDLAGLTAALAAGSVSDWFDALTTSIFYPDDGALVEDDLENNSPDDAATVPQEQDL